jgi:hypothetical protein
MNNQQLYDLDFHAWANEQAALLRAGKLSEADIEHIAEEIESIGKSEKRELISRLTVLLAPMLKWSYQPDPRGKSWRLTMEEQRDERETHLVDNPRLKSTIEDSVVVAYRRAILGAVRETDMDRSVFPTVCPWSFEQMMDPTFYPEAIH